jgi:hypothetical protein
LVHLGWAIDILDVEAEGEFGCSTKSHKNPAGLDDVTAPGYDDQGILDEA